MIGSATGAEVGKVGDDDGVGEERRVGLVPLLRIQGQECSGPVKAGGDRVLSWLR